SLPRHLLPLGDVAPEQEDRPPMSRTHHSLPDAERLRAFALGHLDPADGADVEAHVAACAECCAQLNAAPDDTFIGRLREGAAGDDTVAPDHPAAGTMHLPPGLVDHPTYEIL